MGNDKARSRFFLSALLITSLLLITLDLRGNLPSEGLRKFSATVSSPFQSVFNSIYRPVSTFTGDLFSLGRTRSKITNLQNENAALKEELSRKTAIKNEVKEYENAIAENSSITWKKFLKDYPNNSKVSEIREKIIRLEVDEIMGDKQTGRMPESIQYTEYFDNGGHYDWHQDIGPGELSIRKVSVTIQLSDSDEYEGGDLEFLRGATPEQAPRGKGVAVLFPSYLLHRVTPLTGGTRRSLVLWLGGSHYK